MVLYHSSTRVQLDQLVFIRSAFMTEAIISTIRRKIYIAHRVIKYLSVYNMDACLFLMLC